MSLSRRGFLHCAVGIAALPAFAREANAQTYPSRPITLVVPFGAGGPSDTIARILVEGMRTPIGQPVIIENIPGASGTIGLGRVARAAPDGYTLVLGNWATHVLNGPMFTLSYDLQKDFEPVSLVSSDPLIIVARKSLPANNLKEFIAWLKANPDAATQGTTGAGGISTVGGLFFQKETGTHFKFVPYRSGLGAAMQDLVAGQIDFMIDTAANSLPQVRASAIKAFAITSKQRLESASDVPTVEEEGLPGLYALNWQAVFLPKATPDEIVSKVNAAVVAALADETVRKRLANIGQNIFPKDQQTPQALRAFQSAEIERWWPIVRAANLKAG
jgi:tripartite-type tricarboxylate transporter receptor subunit TctC